MASTLLYYRTEPRSAASLAGRRWPRKLPTERTGGNRCLPARLYRSQRNTW